MPGKGRIPGLPKFFAGAIESSFDPALAGAENGRTFGVAQVFDAGEDKDFAVAGGEGLQGAVELFEGILPIGVVIRGRAGSFKGQFPAREGGGEGLEPRGGPLPEVVAAIDRDPVKPGRKAGLRLVFRQSIEGSHKDILTSFGGILPASQKAQAEGEDAVLVAFNEFSKGALITVPGGADPLAFESGLEAEALPGRRFPGRGSPFEKGVDGQVSLHDRD